MSIKIQKGVSKNQLIIVARIFYESFQDKFALIFGDPKKAIRLISKIVREDRILVAFNDGKVVGFAGLHFLGKKFMACKLTEVARIYGLATLRVLIYFLINLFTEIKLNQLHLEILAVTEKQRGKGIGTKLLLSTIDFARRKGFSEIKLEVVNTNPRANKFYEKMGFKKVKDRKIPYPFNILTGFSVITDMHYNLKK
jgi:ribosomal protein S18 acetylase RimI-like enzyme